MNAASRFPGGVLRPQLFLGVITAVSAPQARVNLSVAGSPSGSHFESKRYGRGEVGEFVLIEGQVDLLLGRLTEVRVPESERRGIGPNASSGPADVLGFIQFLGSVRTDTLRVTAGVASYPRLGDRVYSAPHDFIGQLPELIEHEAGDALTLEVGHVSGASASPVRVRPEKLFGRHCAILGATGGGKSWTVARLVEQCARHDAKLLLLDATGEYRTLTGPRVEHFHLGSPVDKAPSSGDCSLPAQGFQESDFIALFEPSGKVQGPRLREAIRSLRLVGLASVALQEAGYVDRGLLQKANRKKEFVERQRKIFSRQVEDPSCSFDVTKLASQLLRECVFLEGGAKNAPDATKWGAENDGDKSFCLPLAARIHALVESVAFAPVFKSNARSFVENLDASFAGRASGVMRLCLSGVSYEYRAREFIVNAVGRALLNMAREGRWRASPLLVFVDEAHNFLGRSVGNEDSAVQLDAFELIAREGRKYGLNICLATQRPRDLTEGVLSQIGTLIVHRLTNDRDREVVERACGEIDRSASSFLANLRQGEAAIIGVDFPIPLTVQMAAPAAKPASDGPDYQSAWRAGDEHRAEVSAEGASFQATDR